MRLAKFTDLADVNPPRKKISRESSELTSFVPMECVDENTGTIAEVYSEPFEKVSKGYTYFENGDIIFAKITPCMENGKSAIVENLKDGFGFGSTEFIVIRPKKDVYRRWLYQFVRSKDFRLEAEAHFTGSAGQQRVPVPFIENKFVPVPEHDDEIDGIISEVEVKLAHVETMRQAALKQKEAAKALQSAVLREVFPWQAGESLPKGWRWEKVGRYAKFKNGLNYSSSDIQSGVKIVGVSCFQDNFYLDEVNDVEIRKDKVREEDFLKTNDILIVRSNGSADLVGRHLLYVGKEKVTHSGFTIRLRLDDTVINPVFYMYFAKSNFFKGQTKGQGANIKNVSQGKLSNVDIPLPNTIDKQVKIAQEIQSKFESAQKTVAALDNQIAAIEALPAAILREAFTFK